MSIVPELSGIIFALIAVIIQLWRIGNILERKK